MRETSRRPFEYDDIRKMAEIESEFRQIRYARFAHELCRGPAWDMLLELYVSESKHLKTQTVYLAEASGAAHATGMRWVAYLLQEGLIEQVQDPRDKRSKFVSLTDKARMALDQYFFACRNALRRHDP